jgi:hypothetical protein
MHVMKSLALSVNANMEAAFEALMAQETVHG